MRLIDDPPSGRVESASRIWGKSVYLCAPFVLYLICERGHSENHIFSIAKTRCAATPCS